jgi:hypothetical protein
LIRFSRVTFFLAGDYSMLFFGDNHVILDLTRSSRIIGLGPGFINHVQL